MKITAQQVERLLNGDFTFSNLGFSMFLTRIKGVYTQNPSQATLETLTGEINTYLEKFKSIMGKDFSIISKL